MFIQQLKGLYAMFLREPLWYKVLIVSALAAAIVFSSSTFNVHVQAGAKLAAAVFFGAYATRFRGNRWLFMILIALMILCVLLAGKIWIQGE
ncbi:hypothetical protein [Saccharibacillus kuerlensis]|uniref:Uncharacterized protein n=1 Tax=Saccharibacillus kuerlensis TaxID=459527 RepID=A0ABQ2LA95_9BACL|nr:hypothetical protein [Saccharibacillus kuerlensis]GGO08304.1 hypothetical protein GCM10010969_37630 [Saccharibacillus kuerlensis]